MEKFYTVTCPRQDPKSYKMEIAKILEAERVDIFIPVCSPASEYWDSEIATLAKAKGMTVLHVAQDVFKTLEDKHLYCEYTKELGLPTPQTHLLSTEQDVYDLNKKLQESQDCPPFIMKNLEYDPAHRLDLFPLPSPEDNIRAYLAKIKADGNAICPEHPW